MPITRPQVVSKIYLLAHEIEFRAQVMGPLKNLLSEKMCSKEFTARTSLRSMMIRVLTDLCFSTSVATL